MKPSYLYIRQIVLWISVFSAYGCSTYDSSQRTASLAASAEQNNFGQDGSPPLIDVTRFIDVVESHGSSDTDAGGETPIIPQDSYTQLLIERVPFKISESAESRHQNYDASGAIRRFLLSRFQNTEISISTLLPGFKNPITTSLVSLASNRNWQEESWSTSINNTSPVTAWFRADPTTHIRFTPQFFRNEKAEFRGTSLLLDLFRKVANVVQPNSSILTAITRRQVDELAGAVDDQISQLFNRSIMESESIDTPVVNFEKNISYLVKLDIPCASIDISGSDDCSVGLWRIRFAEPRISAFFNLSATEAISNPEKLKEQYTQLSGEEILTYKVSDSLSVRQFIQSQEWYTKTVQDIGITPENKRATSELCDQIRQSVYDLGFNRGDTIAILWAFIEGSALAEQLKANDSCTDDIEKKMFKKIKPKAGR